MIIVLNGPPGSGKDALVPLLEESFSVIHFSTSESLKLSSLGALGLLEAEYEPDDFEDKKDIPNPLFNDMKPRDFYIGVAEGLKAVFGHDLWTKTLIRKIKLTDEMLTAKERKRTLYIVTGMGFPIEMGLFENDPDIKGRTLLVRIKRPGKTFEKLEGYEQAYGDGTGKDSRNWLFSDVVREIEIDNNGSLHDYKINFMWHLKEYFDIKKYALERNDKDISVALMKKSIQASEPLVRFEKPYKIYLPGDLQERRQNA